MQFKPLFFIKENSINFQSKAATGEFWELPESHVAQSSVRFLKDERGIPWANASGTWVGSRLCYTEPCCFTAILVASRHVPLGFCVPGPLAQTEQRVTWSGKREKEEECIRGRQCSVNVKQQCPCDSWVTTGGPKAKNPPGIIGKQSASENQAHLEDDLLVLSVNNDSKLLCIFILGSLCSFCLHELEYVISYTCDNIRSYRQRKEMGLGTGRTPVDIIIIIIIITIIEFWYIHCFYQEFWSVIFLPLLFLHRWE